MARNPFEETARAGGQPGYTTPSRSYNEPPSERVWDPSRIDEPTITTGGGDNIEAILESHRGPYIPPTREAFEPPLPEGFRSRNWHPMFNTMNEMKEWEKMREKERRREKRRREEELLEALLLEEGDKIRHGLSGWYGPDAFKASGNISYEPFSENPLESVMGKGRLEANPFGSPINLSAEYTIGPGVSSDLLDLTAGAGLERGGVYGTYNPLTDYGMLGGELNIGDFDIAGGLGSDQQNFLNFMYSKQYSKGGIVDLLR